MEADEAGPKLCRRCSEREVTLKIRSEAICGPCYRRFVNVKTVKRLEKLAAEIGAAPTRTKRVLVGLSLGASSAALVDVLSDLVRGQLKKRPSASFDVVVVHVEQDDGTGSGGGPSPSPSPSPSQELLDRYARRYPHFRFLRVPLSTALELDAVDWAALSPPSRDDAADADDITTDPTPAPARLQALLARLPSPTSRADARRLLVRHVLLAAAAREGCRALLLGPSTTALAETTLAETAKGRGFSLPWMVGDGPVMVRRPGGGDGDGARLGEGEEEEGAAARGGAAQANGESRATEGVPTTRLEVHHPNRDLFRGELERYVALVEPPLTELVASAGEASSRDPAAAVVSHRDLSIDEVMTRYFAEVEQNYPSIVANVVRTTAKLNRPGNEGEEACCGLCGMGLDELGDERWKGEIGDDGGGEDGRLCYGCSRAMRA